MRIIPLSEGAFTIDATKIFIPFDKLTDDLQLRPRGSLLVEIQPFAIILESDILLIDTGLGFMQEEEMQVVKNLKANGIEATDVTKVLLSHLHKDHSGGISFAAGSARKLTFPNATYYINRKEFELALSHPSASYEAELLAFLRDEPQVVFTDDEGMIGENIRFEVTGGHSTQHQVFWVTDGGETAFFGGDVAPQMQQLRNRFIAKYDFDGKKSMELRQKWKSDGEQHHWQMLFYHDIKSPVITL